MKAVRCLSGILVACGILAGGVCAPVLQAQQVLAQETAPTQAPAGGAQAGGSPLSQEEVTKRLDAVPVFTIVSQEGTPVLANVTRNDQQVQVASFWLDQEEALATMEKIRETNPDIGGQTKVVPLSLGYAFKVAEEQRQKDSAIVFQILPDTQIATSALELLKKNEPERNLQEFPGVPLFYGQSDQGVLTVEANGDSKVPFFFNQADLQAALDRAQADNPQVTSKTQIQVTTLAQVLDSMMNPNAEANVQKIEFVPSRSALEYIRSLPQDQQQGTIETPAQ